MSSTPVLLAERVRKLVTALSDGVFEREDTMKLCLLAALSGESVFLLGPPGIAKSMIAKRLINAFDNSSYFEYLMTRFSTPEEVFGPLSIQELKDNGRYVRLVDGYLPTSQVVFLDEIWKAGPAILNTLLTVVNEKTFKNGSETLKVPMRLLISASNELPDPDSGLDALYDRMLVRVFVNRIQNKNNFRSMLTTGTSQETVLPAGLAITHNEYHEWQKALDSIPLSVEIFEKLYQLKELIEKQNEELNDPTEGYISDRRWKKSVKLLKASAFFNGRDQITPLDILLLQDCIWNTPGTRESVREVIAKFAQHSAFDQEQINTKIDVATESMQRIEHDMVDTLSVQVNLDHNEKSRFGRKELVSLDLQMAKRFSVGHSKDLVRLIILEGQVVRQGTESNQRYWLFVNADELKKKIALGTFEIHGYENEKPDLCLLQFELDSEGQLKVKDSANRSLSVGISGLNNSSQSKISDWKEIADNALAELKSVEEMLMQSKSAFQNSLPHNFIDMELAKLIERSIQQLRTKVESGRKYIQLVSTRVICLTNYYE